MYLPTVICNNKNIIYYLSPRQGRINQIKYLFTCDATVLYVRVPNCVGAFGVSSLKSAFRLRTSHNMNQAHDRERHISIHFMNLIRTTRNIIQRHCKLFGTNCVSFPNLFPMLANLNRLPCCSLYLPRELCVCVAGQKFQSDKTCFEFYEVHMLTSSADDPSKNGVLIRWQMNKSALDIACPIHFWIGLRCKRWIGSFPISSYTSLIHCVLTPEKKTTPTTTSSQLQEVFKLQLAHRSIYKLRKIM